MLGKPRPCVGKGGPLEGQTTQRHPIQRATTRNATERPNPTRRQPNATRGPERFGQGVNRHVGLARPLQ